MRKRLALSATSAVSVASAFSLLAAPVGALTAADPLEPDTTDVETTAIEPVETERETTGAAVVTLLTDATAPIVPGTPAWVALAFAGDPELDVWNFAVRATATPGIEIGFPHDHFDHARDHTSLWAGDSLAAAAMDFAALWVAVEPGTTSGAITLTVSYDSHQGPQSQTLTTKVDVDAKPFDGPALTFGDDTLGSITQGEGQWLHMDVAALADVTGVSFRVRESSGLGVEYPGNATSSGLAEGTDLAKDRTDFTAFYFDTADLAPGFHTVEIEATYFAGGTKSRQSVTKRIEVIAAGETPTPVDPEPGDPTPVEPGPVVVATLMDSAADWVVNPFGTDTAVTGIWGFGRPDKGVWDGHVTELGHTPSGAPGLFTLSGTGTAVGDNDVDDGVTSILSPVFTLPADGTITLEFAYYLAYLGNASPEDYLKIEIRSDRGTTVVLREAARTAVFKDAEWKSVRQDLTKLAGQDIRIHIEVADHGIASLIEAAVADLVIVAEPNVAG